MKIRIHHFFDIIRDFGSEQEIIAHPYGHSYHKVAKTILDNPDTKLELVIGADVVCKNCIKLKNNKCLDTISHRNDFTQKEDFNNYLDNKIMTICMIDPDKVFNPVLLCEIAPIYLENIEVIYEGNDVEHTKKRKQNVVKGLNFYAQKHNLQIIF